jgi:hypothetical protein
MIRFSFLSRSSAILARLFSGFWRRASLRRIFKRRAAGVRFWRGRGAMGAPSGLLLTPFFLHHHHLYYQRWLLYRSCFLNEV